MSDRTDGLIRDMIGNGIMKGTDNPEFRKRIGVAQRRVVSFSNQAKEELDYDYSLQNPLMTSSIKVSDEYLSRLQTADGLSLTWKRIESFCLESYSEFKA